jgi:hypothetical protein
VKKRVRTQPSNPFYSNEPAVATSKIADKALIPQARGRTPKMVDKNPGKLSGLAGFMSHTKPKAKNHVSVPKFGTKAKQPASMKPPKGPRGGFRSKI